MKTILKISSILILSSVGFAKTDISDSQIKKVIESSFPKAISSLTDSNSGQKLTLGGGGLDYKYKRVDLDGDHQNNYVIILYRADISSTESACELDVIKLKGSSGTLTTSTTLNGADELSNCIKIQDKYLDEGKSPEILITTTDSYGGSYPPLFFKWDGSKLVDITPLNTFNGAIVPLLRNAEITDLKIGRSLLIIDKPAAYATHGQVFSQSPDQSYKTYVMQNGTLTVTGTYDFLSIITKNFKDSATVLNPTLTAGSYTLSLKNLSSHERAVRAEVTINGNVVLKPQDFCSSPQPGKGDKDKWKGNDDDDDKDEDHCKRCAPKQEADAVVNLNATNTIKVKVYGRQDSKLELTLVKKP